MKRRPKDGAQSAQRERELPALEALVAALSPVPELPPLEATLEPLEFELEPLAVRLEELWRE